MATTKTHRFGFLRQLLGTKPSKSSQSRQQGFTLIELLVAMIVGSLIISTLLYVVVELLTINRREEVLTQTQQDMRRAVDYITRDLSEAIFVYADPTTVTDQLGIRPNDEPVLAFWRLDPVDISNLPVNMVNSRDQGCLRYADAGRQAECNTLKVRQSAYTLVVYFSSENANDDIWGGPSKIVRYELPKYGAGSLTGNPPSLSQVNGYRDPTLDNTTFENWTPRTGAIGGNIATLTDFVDSADVGEVTCPAGTNYVPTNTATGNFYACVNVGAAVGDDEFDNALEASRINRSVLVFLRGNATNNRAGFVTFSADGRLPIIESEVLIRGVVQKRPDS